MNRTAVGASAEPPDDDDFVAEIRHHGHQLIVQGLYEVLMERLLNEMVAWHGHLQWIEFQRWLENKASEQQN